MKSGSITSSLRYIVVVLSVATALIFTLQVDLLEHRTPFALFFAAVMLSAWYGGQNFGLATILLSVLVTDYFILPPLYSFAPGSINFLEESVFIAVALLIVSLTSAHQRSEKSLRESEERHRVITQTASDGIVTLDEAGTILFANRAMQTVFGYPYKELVGQTLARLIPDFQPTKQNLPDPQTSVIANSLEWRGAAQGWA